MIRTLSIPEWHRMALEGTAPPMRILLNGASMKPLIRWNRDYVTIIPPDDGIIPGDIVLLADPMEERFVAHRLWEVRDGQVLTWGDNCPEPDGWLPADHIWGKVILIERGKRIIHPDPEKGLRWAVFWRKIRPIYIVYLRIKEAAIRRIKKLKG